MSRTIVTLADALEAAVEAALLETVAQVIADYGVENYYWRRDEKARRTEEQA